MNTISFMTANFVARQLAYHMTDGWGQGDGATQAYFRPLETYAARFGALLDEVQAMGFTEIDIWGAHLHPEWATDEHISIARDLLNHHNLKAISIAGWWDTLTGFEASCKIAVGIGAGILGGGGGLIEHDRAGLIRLLEQYDLRYGLENHPEKTPEEVLARLGDPAGGRMGVTLDTGWFGTQGYDAAEAIKRLADRLVYLHLKDVKSVGTHVTCRFGTGVVPIERCAAAVKEIGYQGGISIEHEPEDSNPTEDVKASLALLRGWLS